MSNKKGLNRRDFLKYSSMAAITAPIANKVGKIGEYDLHESEELYGGFLIRTLADDDTPFIFDEDKYERFDGKNIIFSRLMWDTPFADWINSTELLFKPGDPGYSHLDRALGIASGFISGYGGTSSSAVMLGRHSGMLSLTPDSMAPPSDIHFEGRWDHSHLSPEEVAKVVKKATKYLGASLVGIAPLNEKWIYSKYFDPFLELHEPIQITEVEEVILPEGQVTRQEAGELIKAKLETWEGAEIKAFLGETVNDN